MLKNKDHLKNHRFLSYNKVLLTHVSVQFAGRLHSYPAVRISQRMLYMYLNIPVLLFTATFELLTAVLIQVRTLRDVTSYRMIIPRF